MDQIGRDAFKVIILMSTAPALLFGLIFYQRFADLEFFEQIEVAVLFLAMILASVNYLKTTQIVSSVGKRIEEKSGGPFKLSTRTASILFDYGLALVTFTTCIVLVISEASAFTVLGLIFCIYMIFVRSNLAILEMVSSDIAVLAESDRHPDTYNRDYISLSMTNLFFLRSENLPTCYVYLLLLTVCFLGESTSSHITRETIQAFAGGAAAVHLVASTIRFNQIIRDSSTQPIYKKDVIEQMMEIFGPHSRDKTVAVNTVCSSTRQGFLLGKSIVPLILILVSGVGLSILGALKP